MDASDAIEEISPERRETLVAAWQNMKPKTSMQTLFSKCNMASAMAAVDFKKPRSKFERSLKDIRNQTSAGKKDERERRVAAFLVFLSPQTGLNDFLKVVDFPAATRALGKTYSEKWFKGYIRIIVKSVLEKAKPIDRVEDDDDDEEGSDYHEENDNDGHDRSIVVASLSSSNNIVDLTDEDDEDDEDDKKIVIDLTNEDNDGDSTTAASTDHSPKTGKKRKAADGDVEVKTGATAADHKRPRLPGRSDQAADRDTESEDNDRKKNATFAGEDTIYYFPSEDEEQTSDHSVFAASQPSLPNSPDPVEDDEESIFMPDFVESKPKRRVSTMKENFMVERRLRRLRGIRMRQVLEQIDAPELLKTAFLSQTCQGTPGSGVSSTNDGNDKTADNDASSTQKKKSSVSQRPEQASVKAKGLQATVHQRSHGKASESSKTKTPASSIEAPGKPGSALSKPTSAPSNGRIEWFKEKSQKYAQDSAKKLKMKMLAPALDTSRP